ncbi:MAG: DUF1501 domain-containing protein [Planctomycetes bacterium]|nr:DUF1501 domain-containing protein [Planctomycetota bacterium]
MSCCDHELPVSRRGWLTRVVQAGGAALLAPSLADLFVQSARGQQAGARTAKKHLVLVWLAGGPSQFETFDPKPGTPAGGPTGALPTDVPGWSFSEHLPLLRDRAGQLAVLRTLRSTEGSHARATDLLHFGYTPTPALALPTIGSIVAHQIGDPDHPLPPFVQVDGMVGSSGYLGVDVSPFVVRDPNKPIENLTYRRGVDATRLDRRERLRAVLEAGFAAGGGGHEAKKHDTLRARARRLMDTELVTAFELAEEPDAVRDGYGRGSFGQGMLLARRLVERGVAAVEVTLRGWDTHLDNFITSPKLCRELDQALSALIDELRARSLHEDTLIVCLGEFGRSPTINANAGRDHWPSNQCVLFSGGGVRGGQVLGATDETGEHVVGAPATVADLFATIAASVGVDGSKDLTGSGTRPMNLIDPAGKPIRELFKA